MLILLSYMLGSITTQNRNTLKMGHVSSRVVDGQKKK